MEHIIENIRSELKKYIIDNGLRSLVIGMSGGVDSTLCAALAEPVVKELHMALCGMCLPTITNTDEENRRADEASKAFCTTREVVKIDGIVDIFKDHMNDERAKIRNGNIKARVRMIMLYHKAAQWEGLVLSTDNYTEYMLGFWTLHGDHADYGMIQNMWKTEVYKLARFFARQFKHTNEIKERVMLEAINAVPTDGLGVSKSDCEQFGVATYDEVDKILKEWLTLKRDLSNALCSETENIFMVLDALKSFFSSIDFSMASESLARAVRIRNRMEEMQDNPVVQRHERTHFKRKWPISIPRDILGFGGYL